MCGIFGVWNFKGVTGRHLHRVSELLRHRGPDDEGFVVERGDDMISFSGKDSAEPHSNLLPDDSACFNALLHRRLSIIDLSPRGRQPMSLAGHDLHIVFNGEVYNFEELKSRFDIQTRSGTDTEVILALYAKIGIEAFSEMRGMWALAILDKEQGKMILSRDRFGIKPLYFVNVGDGLAFSSEIKPLLTLPGVEARWERSNLMEFVTYGASTDPDETFFTDIHALPPGQFLIRDLYSDHQETRSYYNLRERISHTEYAGSDFSELFTESIREHLVGDVEVGSCLSGGLDSSLIVAEAAKLVTGNLQTFTLSFPGESIDEADYARMLKSVVPNLNQHFTTPTAQEFLDAWDELITLQERPIGSASIFAQYAVMQSASEAGIKVLLDGQGADEVFGGYYSFPGAYLLSILKTGNLPKLRREYQALEENFNPRMDVAMFRAGYYALPANLQGVVRRKGRMGYELLAQPFRIEAKAKRGPDRGSPDFTELSFKSIEYGLRELLHYEDRNSMHFNIESRVPFLDHRLVEWALAAPTEVKLQNGWTKYPIRKALDTRKIPELAWRKDKLGFVAPQKRWRQELKSEWDEVLSRVSVSEVFDRKAVDELFVRDLNRNEDLTAFWRIFALLKWMDKFKIDLV